MAARYCQYSLDLEPLQDAIFEEKGEKQGKGRESGMRSFVIL